MTVMTALRRKMQDWVVGNLRLVDPRFYAWLDGSPAASGQQVTVNSALQLATVWSCVRLISETVATLPLAVYEVDGTGRKTPARTHPLYTLLHDSPNADMTACEMWEALFASLVLWGNAYAWKDMSGRRINALHPLRSEWMKPHRDENGFIVYRYHDPDARGGYVDYQEDVILHLKGFGVTGLMGMSPIAYARNSMGNVMAVEEAVGSTFRNGLRPSGVLSTDQILTRTQREQYTEKLADKFSGTVNAGKVMTLEAGFKYQPITLPPEDAQMLQTREYQVEEICRWFRVPPFMVGHTTKATSWGTGLEQQMIGFLTFALRPYLTRAEQAVRKSLIAAPERGRIVAEFNLEGLLRADSQGRAALYSTMAQNGIFTRNEIRAKENLPPIDGGDVLTVQSNLLPIDQLGRVPVPAPNLTQEPAP